MNDRREDRPDSVDRRRYLGSIVVGLTSLLAGCSQSDCDSSKKECTEGSNGPDGARPSQSYRRVRDDITSVLDTINDRPIRVGRTFVFDPEDAMTEAEVRDLSSTASEALQAAREIDEKEERLGPSRLNLIQSAQLATLLVDQRARIDYSMMAGVSFRQKFAVGEYEDAGHVVEKGADSLEMLLRNGSEIEDLLEEVAGSTTVEDRYGTDAIKEDLQVLLEVLRWSVPVYDGFENTARGMVSIQRGNIALNGEDYESARTHYERGRQLFDEAGRAFDAAHGAGQRVDLLVPYVEHLRCLVPGLSTNYKELDEGIKELVAGNEETGLEITADVLTRMESTFSRCS